MIMLMYNLVCINVCVSVCVCVCERARDNNQDNARQSKAKYKQNLPLKNVLNNANFSFFFKIKS